MSASPEIARANGRKGGRPKGRKSDSTLAAEAYKKTLVDKIIKNKEPLAEALIKKGLAGDVQALKEIHERSMGKVTDVLDLNYGSETIEALKNQLKEVINVGRTKKDLP